MHLRKHFSDGNLNRSNLTELVLAIQQYLYARQTNYCWSNSCLGWVRFKSTLKASRLAWIRLSNLFIIVISAGLLIPWAKVRRAHYILSNLAVITTTNLDGFTKTAEPHVGALGESATDIFDIDIGF